MLAVVLFVALLALGVEGQSTSVGGFQGFACRDAITSSQFGACYPPSGNYSYALYRLSTNDGAVDNTGVTNVVNSRKFASESIIDAFFDPKVSSPGKAKKVVKAVLKALTTALTAASFNPSYSVSRMFLNCTSGAGTWGTSKKKIKKNVKYIKAMAKVVPKTGKAYFGIITNSASYAAITKSSKSLAKTLVKTTSLMWLAAGNQSFTDYTQIGQWTSPAFRIYQSFVTIKCGSSSFVGDNIY